jgi:CRISPR-associated protein Csx10
MTRSRRLTITLLSDTVISERSATTGQHRTLDYVPGSCLLGAAAARLYARLGDAAFSAFHTGELRFCDAHPVTAAGLQTHAAPLCWHYPKATGAWIPESPHRLDVCALRNLARGAWSGTEQPKQLKQGWFAADGSWHDVSSIHRMKTALSDAVQAFGVANEGQLFGYSAMRAGQRFGGTLTAEPSLPESTWNAVLSALEGDDLRLGRSKSAEFGRARLQWADGGSWSNPAPRPAPDVILVYAASDLALRCANGQPRLTPSKDLLGLQGAGRYLPQRSFLRTRSYTPWNSKRNAPDLERQVIGRGSVMVFERVEPSQQNPEAWVGAYQQDGLGHILIDPWFLAAVQPTFEVPAEPLQSELAHREVSEEAMSHPLVQLCQRRFADHQIELLAVRYGQELATTWGRYSPSPGKTQWSRVRHAAVTCTTRTELSQALSSAEHSVFGPQKDWRRHWKGKLANKELPREILKQLRDDATVWKERLGEAGIHPATDQRVDTLVRGVLREAATLRVRALQKEDRP